ncbi:MAG TPA: hypothetical protein VN767_07560 [Streptosporangiaceae bacterium]|jgi:hypothetical protein|nr:hypothetical protein [Streptosporangiaceae bacterium]
MELLRLHPARGHLPECTCQMRLSHDPLKISASFDEANLVSRAGLVPVMGLAERAGLAALARRHVTIGASAAVRAGSDERLGLDRDAIAGGSGRPPKRGQERTGYLDKT